MAFWQKNVIPKYDWLEKNMQIDQYYDNVMIVDQSIHDYTPN